MHRYIDHKPCHLYIHKIMESACICIFYVLCKPIIYIYLPHRNIRVERWNETWIWDDEVPNGRLL